MPVDTRTFPGTITKGQGGEQVARGWCLIAYEMTGRGAPLNDWRGEIALDADGYAALKGASGDLYLFMHPYGGENEPWHGPIKVEPVSNEHDPNQRRMK